MAAPQDQPAGRVALLAALARVGVGPREVAAVTGVADAGWPDGADGDDADRRLAELGDLVVDLTDTFTPAGVAQWLTSRNRLLDGRRPLDVIADGQLDRVRAAAAALVDGAYV